MIKVINQNPFRILGVTVNSSIKEITANKGKMAAFAKVGKSINFPLDLSSILTPINRSVENIDNAVSQINLPIDKIKYALFWFINITSIDNIVINYIQNGNLEKAIEILEKKKTFSSLLNRGVIAFIQKDLEIAIEKITELIYNDEYRRDFIETICDSTFNIDSEDLAALFINELMQNFDIVILLNAFEKYGGDSTAVDYIKNIIIDKPITLIKKEVEKAKNCGDNADEYYNAGILLIKNTKDALLQLRKFCSNETIQYQSTIDNLARQILQCGINYFNDSDSDDAVEKALIIQKYALEISVGKLLRDRCQENIDVLNNQMATHKIRKELSKLVKLIDKCKKMQASHKYIPCEDMGPMGHFSIRPDSNFIDKIAEIINDSKKELDLISSKLGSDNKFYIDFSDTIVHISLNKLIEFINDFQKWSSNRKEELNNKIKQAITTMELIGELSMKSKTRTFYNTNLTTLKGIFDKLNPSFYEKNTGCVWFVIIGLIIAIIASLA